MSDDIRRQPRGSAEESTDRLDRLERAVFGYQDEGGIYVAGLLQTLHTIKTFVVRGGAFLGLVASSNFLHTWLPVIYNSLKGVKTP